MEQHKLTKKEFVELVLYLQTKRKRQKYQLTVDTFGNNLRRCRNRSRYDTRAYNKTYSRYTAC